ncbi:MAG: hypothetical protein IJF65_05170 [Clostridia bacterium]|nr:hypothetical protein [Clostridia bacterium]
MKKCLLLTLVLVLIFAAALADSAPDSIQKAFSASQWKDWHISRWEANDSLAVVILRKEAVNRLCVLTPSGSGWKVLVHNHRALYQGDRLPDDILLDGSGAFELHYGQNILRFAKNQNIWRISRLELFDEQLTYPVIVVYSDKLVYKRAVGDEREVTVEGVTNRDLQHFILKELPRTPESARAALSLPPYIPQGGLSAQVVDFEGGHRFPVYAGPGTDYHRPVNGKCVVSTNDWIQVFGQENGWLLIQYDRNADSMRFGYIPADSLKESSVSINDINDLEFVRFPIKTLQAAELTDDPLFGRAALTQIPQGASLTYLTRLADWAYVEYTPADGEKMRGFIPFTAIEMPQATLAPKPTAQPTPAPSQKVFPIKVSFPTYDVEGEAVITDEKHLTVTLTLRGGGIASIDGYSLFMNHNAVDYASAQDLSREYFRKPEVEYGSTRQVEFTYTLSPMPSLIGLCPVKNGQLIANEMISLIP